MVATFRKTFFNRQRFIQERGCTAILAFRAFHASTGEPVMDRFIPDGFLTARQAVAKLVLAKFGGLPDRAVVHALKEEGIDVADGAAADDAFAEIWAAMDDGKLQLFVMSSKDHLRQHELTPKMASQIPGLRSPRGRDLTFLRNRHPLMPQFVKWFGKDIEFARLNSSLSRRPGCKAGKSSTAPEERSNGK